MEEEEKLTEAELREDAESYLNKLRLRSEFAIIIGVPLLLFLCFAEYSFNRDLMVMILYAVLCVILALSNIMRCKAIKSIDFHNLTLREIADQMKMLKKRRRLMGYVVCGCLWICVAVISFLNWGFSIKSFIMIAVWTLIAVGFFVFRKRSLNNDDYDDMISQLENSQLTDL